MYVKLFGTIIFSSIWMEDHATVRLWITMLAMADETGYVKASRGGLAHTARLTPQEFKVSIDKLESPDLDSQDQDYAGRRVEKVDGGWLVLNYKKYREIRTKKQMQDAARQRKRYDKLHQKDGEVSRTSRDITTTASEYESESVDGTPEEDRSRGETGESEGEERGVSLVPVNETGAWIAEALHEVDAIRFEEDRLLWEARTVFAYWTWRAKKNGKRVVLTDDRKTRLNRYLRIYGLEDCLLAVEGAWHHRDHNQQDGRTYRELEHIFKLREGSGTVEKLRDAGTKKRVAVDKVLAKLIAQGYNPGVEDA